MTWVWDRSDASGADLLLLLAIADCADDTGRNAWPSTGTLARKTRVSERTVQRMIKRLVSIGALHVDWNDGPRGTNRFTVVMHSDTPAVQNPVSDPRQIDGGDNLTPRQHGDGGTPDTHGVGGTSFNVHNPPTPLPAIGAYACPRHTRSKDWCVDCLAGPPPELPDWCGKCSGRNDRWVDLHDGLRAPCARCSPQALAGEGNVVDPDPPPPDFATFAERSVPTGDRD